MSETISVRPIEPADYHKQYLQLLQMLTSLNPRQISEPAFQQFVNNLNTSHQIWVIEEHTTNKIIGTITILIEQKIIHNFGKVCHIEDVVIDKTYRGLGLGKLLVDKAIDLAEENKCYKTILDCDQHKEGFYERCGFHKKCSQMTLYHVII
jgi:glucosamine-phosphate N-acetyltransferase